MAETEPRKSLIIKLYLPRSEKRGAPSNATDSRCEKRRKVDSAKPIISKTQCNTAYSYADVGNSEKERGFVKENSRVDAKDSRKVSEECEIKGTVDVDYSRGKKKMMKVATTTRTTCCSTEYSATSFVKENSRADSRTGSEEECKKEEKNNMLDRYKKMQCWVILKRMMIGRDGWALKQPLDLKALGILDNSESYKGLSKSTGLYNNTESNKLKNNNSETMLRRPIGLENGGSKLKNNNSETNKLRRPIGLEDIESKLKKWLYSGPDEFADDIRLVFSHALLYPPRSEIHKIARRLSESFELSWKSLKEKWTLEERKAGKKICKKEVCPKVDREEVYERKTQKGNKGCGRDFCDSSHYWDPKRRSRSNTSSPPSFQSEAWSQKEQNMSISGSNLSPERSSCTSMLKGHFVQETEKRNNKLGIYEGYQRKHRKR